MEKTIALIPGDGIGPDVVKEAVNVLDAVAKKFGHKWNYTNVLAGGCAIDKFGHPLPQDQLEICLKSDAALLGAVGGPKWDNLPSEIRPEKALLGLRGGMKVFANLRPAVMWKQLKDACPLKDEIVGGGNSKAFRFYTHSAEVFCFVACHFGVRAAARAPKPLLLQVPGCGHTGTDFSGRFPGRHLHQLLRIGGRDRHLDVNPVEQRARKALPIPSNGIR